MEDFNDLAVSEAPSGAQPDDAALVTLASAMKLQFADEPAARRAIDRAVVYLRSAPIYEFDGVELRVVSLSRRSEGIVYISDGHSCTCQGAASLVLPSRTVSALPRAGRNA